MDIIIPRINLLSFNDLNFICIKLIVTFCRPDKGAHQREENCNRRLQHLNFLLAIRHIVVSHIVDEQNRQFSGRIFNNFISLLHVPIQTSHIPGPFAKRLVNIVNEG